MGNSTTNNGKQTITFCYQQEGTAQGFNKILHGILPRGVIQGGTLTKGASDSYVNIAPLQMLIGDNDVTIHVETAETAEIKDASASQPFIIATFQWENITNSYVNFQAVHKDNIPDNAIILGECIYNGSILSVDFDYTRKTWTSSHYHNDFGWDNSYHTKSPCFNVTCDSSVGGGTYELIIERGEAIINGKYVSLDSNTNKLALQINNSSAEDYFNPVVNNGRTDIVILRSDKRLQYIMGDDDGGDSYPICRTNALTLARLTFGAGTYQKFTGDKITYVFNDNYYGGSPTQGKVVGTTVINPHTLYL